MVFPQELKGLKWNKITGVLKKNIYDEKNI